MLKAIGYALAAAVATPLALALGAFAPYAMGGLQHFPSLETSASFLWIEGLALVGVVVWAVLFRLDRLSSHFFWFLGSGAAAGCVAGFAAPPQWSVGLLVGVSLVVGGAMFVYGVTEREDPPAAL